MIALIVGESDEVTSLYSNYGDSVLYELRLDLDLDLLEAVDKEIPAENCIITLRSKQEGGEYTGNQSTQILLDAIEQKPKYLDLEYSRDLFLFEEVVHQGIIPIISKHDYTTNMIYAAADYKAKIDALDIDNSDVVIKFVGKSMDTLDALLAYDKFRYIDNKIILSTVPNGSVLRTCRQQLNQKFVFGSTFERPIPAIEKLADLSQDSMYFGLVGQSLTHTKSPFIHHQFLQNTGINGYYHKFEVSNHTRFHQLIPRLRDLGIDGINITFPYKREAATLAEEVGYYVKKSGVANTINFTPEKVKAHNTDITGFITFCKEIDLDKFDTVLIVGAGGAGKAVGISIIELGLDVTFVNRSKERFNDFPSILENTNKFVAEDFENKKQYDVYVNATSIGYEDKSVTDFIAIPDKTKLVIDLNYSKGLTPLGRRAHELEIPFYDGMQMLINQARDAFEIWTGKKPKVGSLLQRLREESI